MHKVLLLLPREKFACLKSLVDGEQYFREVEKVGEELRGNQTSVHCAFHVEWTWREEIDKKAFSDIPYPRVHPSSCPNMYTHTHTQVHSQVYMKCGPAC